ncbi:MAG: hypothetical protein DHS20C21_06110 [Gemmatimonadota bacterium]|nr:MAG: hypothetical protein DHS20C21_06110 [Gemmatimonadota bacterium]
MTPYPQHLAVFSVPAVVLFPHTHLPLRGTGDRQRAVVAHSLAEGKRLVVAVRRPGPEVDGCGRPCLYPTACAGRIVGHEWQPDGSSEFVVRGERVVRLLEFDRTEPFRLASLAVSDPEDPPVFEDRPAERLQELRALLERCCPGVYEKLLPGLFRAPELDGGLELVNTLAASFPVDVPHKLEWLQAETPRVRWEGVVRTLEERCRECEQRKFLMNRYRDETEGNPDRN